MRSPMMVWRRMKAHSSASRAAGLLMMASGIATLPTSWSAAACASWRSSSPSIPARRAISLASSATPSWWSPRSGWRSASARRRTSLLWRPAVARPECFWAYMASSALRIPSVASPVSWGISTEPKAAETSKPSPVSESAAHAACSGVLVACVGSDAGRVAAGPVGAAGERRDGLREGGAEALEQGVAGLVAEGVVVVLEAVEVEEREDDRRVGADGADPAVEVDQQLAAIAESREPVGGGLCLELAPAGTKGRTAGGDQQQRERDAGEREGPETGDEARRGRRRACDDEPVVDVAGCPADAPVGHEAAVDLRDAGATGGAGQPDEAPVVRIAEPGPDALGIRAVDDHAAGGAVDDAELGVRGAAHGAPEALDRHLEMHDGPLPPVPRRHRRRVGAAAFLRVRRDVRQRLVRLAEAQREGRREERRLRLRRGELLRPGDPPADDARQLRAVGVDEARLADARRIQLLEVPEMVDDVAQGTAVATHLLGARSRGGEELGEGRGVGGEQDHRLRAREVALERPAVRLGLGDERALELRPIAVAVQLRHPEGGRNENHADDERDKSWYPHAAVLGRSRANLRAQPRRTALEGLTEPDAPVAERRESRHRALVDTRAGHECEVRRRRDAVAHPGVVGDEKRAGRPAADEALQRRDLGGGHVAGVLEHDAPVQQSVDGREGRWRPPPHVRAVGRVDALVDRAADRRIAPRVVVELRQLAARPARDLGERPRGGVRRRLARARHRKAGGRGGGDGDGGAQPRQRHAGASLGGAGRT